MEPLPRSRLISHIELCEPCYSRYSDTSMRITILLLAVSAAAIAADKPEWDNPAIVHVGTEKPHATMMVYPTAELARAGDRTKSPWFQLLNGTWKFHGSLRPAERPVDFYRTDFNDSAWGTMPVPRSE